MKTALLLLAALALPAAASARPAALTAAASYADLDLKSDTGRLTLQERLHGSARDLCHRTAGRCVSRAVARGYMNVALAAIDTRPEVSSPEIAAR